MPVFDAKVKAEDPTISRGKYADIPAYTWGIRIMHDIGSDLHIDANIDDLKTDSDSYHPNFDSLKEVRSDGAIGKVEGGVVGHHGHKTLINVI